MNLSSIFVNISISREQYFRWSNSQKVMQMLVSLKCVTMETFSFSFFLFVVWFPVYLTSYPLDKSSSQKSLKMHHILFSRELNVSMYDGWCSGWKISTYFHLISLSSRCLSSITFSHFILFFYPLSLHMIHEKNLFHSIAASSLLTFLFLLFSLFLFLLLLLLFNEISARSHYVQS